MFKKLISNLPFNPSLINQVAFYAKRMKKESMVRRTALVFMALTLVVQFFAVISPPQSSLASSGNDLIYGGFANRDQAVLHCLDGAEDYNRILANFGITCTNVHDATQVTLRSTDFNRQLFSMGRFPYGLAGEQPVNVNGVGTLWLRYLWGWDKGFTSTYTALSGTSTTGIQFFILFNCGNLVFIGVPPPPPPPTPPPPPPPPPPPVVLPKVISCSNLVMNVADKAKVKINTTLTVRGQAAGQNIPAGQKVDMTYDLVEASTNKVISTAKSLGVAFKGNAADDTNTHDFGLTQAGQYIVKLTVKYDSTKTAAGSATGDCIKSVTVQKPCEEVTSSKDIINCLVPHKTARNVTQNLVDAQTKVANAGDTIEYTLAVANSGNVTIKKFLIQESISDVLDYADVVSLGGGALDKNGLVTWPAIDIGAKQTVKKIITVKVKNPIPSTPASSSDPGHFDCKMTNVYGDTVNIRVNCVAIKTIERTGQLPNTGPGESLAVGFGIALVVGYFFARSRLFAEELTVVRNEYGNSGGI